MISLKIKSKIAALAIILLGWSTGTGVAESPATFVLTVSAPIPTMRVGEDLVVEETISNPTDRVLVAGEGPRVGLLVELLNQAGSDIGLYAMGLIEGKIDGPAAGFSSAKRAMRPGSKDTFTWRFKPVPGHLVPGVYKLRVHQRDMTSHADVYSNTVELTVIP